MIKRKKLGQHFLISKTVASKIIDIAKISNTDIVLEVGTGKGILVPKLCQNAKKVISIEKDKSLYQQAKKKFLFENLELCHGDGFKKEQKFTIFVSNLPYSQSKTAVEWLCQKKFSHAVVMVQKEFAEKLLEEKRAISVLANYCFEIQKTITVKKNNFFPTPKIDSIVLTLHSKYTLPNEIIKTVNLLFSYRRKKLSNILEKFDIESTSEKRLDDLSGDEIIKIAKQIQKQ